MAEVLKGGKGRGEWRMAADLNVPWRAGDTELPSRHHTPPTHQPQCLASKFHAVAPLLCALSLSLTFSGAWCSWIPQPSDARIHWVPLTAKGWWRWGGVRIWGAEMKQERPALLTTPNLPWKISILWKFKVQAKVQVPHSIFPFKCLALASGWLGSLGFTIILCCRCRLHLKSWAS